MNHLEQQTLIDNFFDTIMSAGERCAKKQYASDSIDLSYAYAVGAMKAVLSCLAYVPEVQQMVAIQTKFHQGQHQLSQENN